MQALTVRRSLAVSCTRSIQGGEAGLVEVDHHEANNPIQSLKLEEKK
jgi:hypothetical protein